jgi:hypothetical protein
MRTPVRLPFGSVTVGFGLLFCAFCQPARGDEQVQALDPALQAKIIALVPVEKPSRLIASAVTISEAGPTDDPKQISTEIRAEYTMLENGLIGAVSESISRKNESSGRGIAMSLCGLVTLLSETNSISTNTNNSAIPIGKLFVPFGFKSSLSIGTRWKLVAFEASSPSICNPAPGSEFSIKAETDVELNTSSGIFNKVRTVHRVETQNCKVGSTPIAASTLHPTLSGDYLPVSCEIRTAATTNNSGRSEKAFLLDSKRYLQLGGGNDTSVSKQSYRDVTYVTP